MEKVNDMLNEFGNAKQENATKKLSPTTSEIDTREFNKAFKYASELKRLGIDITSPYPKWVSLAYAFVNEFGESGRMLFHLVSSAGYSGYDEKETDKQYSSCLNGIMLNETTVRVTLGTFYYLAKQQGVTFRNPNAGNSKGRDYQKEAYEMIMTNYDISFDELNQDISIDGKPLDDFALNSILVELSVEHDIKVKKDFVQSIIESKFTKNVNPFLKFVDENKDRNPTGTIEKLANCVITKTGSDLDFNYKLKMFTLFFVKMVAQVLSNVPNDLCLVFLGGKFIGKTYFFSNLLPPQLLQFFSVQSFKNDKDFRRDSGRYMLILDDEFKYLRVATNELIKSLLSATTVTVRVPYGRKPMTYKRIASYCISTNERFILKDHTGNRRLLCFWIDSINWEEFNAIDKVDLIMEAYNLYKSGYDHVLDKTLLDAIEHVSSEFEETSSAEELINQHFPPGELLDRESFWWPVSRIKEELDELTGNKLSDYEIGKALRKLGYSHKFLNVHGSKLCCWLMKKGKFDQVHFRNKIDFPDLVLDNWPQSYLETLKKPGQSNQDQQKINDLPPLDELEQRLRDSEFPG